MQEAGAKAETGGNVLGIANCMTNFLQLCFVGLVHLDVAEDGKVVAGADTSEMGAEIVSQRLSTRERPSVFRIGKQLNTVALEDWLFGRQRAGLLISSSQLASFDFTGFNIRLIEGVDADD